MALKLTIIILMLITLQTKLCKRYINLNMHSGRGKGAGVEDAR